MFKTRFKRICRKTFKKCENCAKIYLEMNNEEENPTTTQNEIDYLKKIKEDEKRKLRLL